MASSSSSSSSDPASPQPPLLLLPAPPEPVPAPAPAPPPPLPEARPRTRASTTVADGVRGLLRSGEALVRAVFRGNSGHPHPPLHPHLNNHQPHQQQHRPADIMKRLQRETFSDVMKLRDKHDQIEHILSLYRRGQGFQLLDLPVQVKIALSAVGALFLVDGDEFKQAKETLDNLGKRTGLSSTFVFESKTRGKDTIAAELSTKYGEGVQFGEAAGRPIELTRLQYCAHINKWLSMILVPFGAQCNNFLHSSSMAQNLQSQAFFDGPPSFLEQHNCAAGLRIEGSKFAASFAELVFGSGGLDSEGGGTNRMTTFGQVSYKPSDDVKLNLSGLWQVCLSSRRFNNLEILAVPIGSLKPATTEQLMVTVQGASPAAHPAESSVALMVDCELYETLKTEAWFQVERSKSNHGAVRWGFTLSDVPDNELGWGVKVGGTAEGNKTKQLQHLDMEGFLNFNLGKGARLQPGLVYARMGEKMTPALFLRSSWFM
ncbi:hypothetical protein BS78_01G226100 [Paspalum vaginatum]|nr:hypothetical protein BS78_01G226100 [Paspalum vaginatum]